MNAYQERINRGRAQHGEKFDQSELYPHLRPWYQGDRVRVRTEWDDGTVWERTGRVSTTTGWRPAFILVSRSNAHGSSDVLGERDRVVARWNGRRYVPASS